MIERDLSVYGKDGASLYRKLYDEAKKQFADVSDNVTVFHEILIDRVTDEYIKSLNLKEASIHASKDNQEKLQKWLSMVFSELSSMASVHKAKKIFVNQVLESVKSVVTDKSILKGIHGSLKGIMNKHKLSDEGVDEL